MSVVPICLEEHVEASMKKYGFYTILHRAIPDVRDGLKPVQRRILYAMYDTGIKPGGKTIKCAKITGEVIGKYHPHGDASVYEALVSLAAPWSSRFPTVKPQGNFGSIQKDPAAHYRYTEAGLTEFGYSQFEDYKYLPYEDNYDGTCKEPTVLSSVLPLLLINGYDGIATGFSGKIPSHSIESVKKVILDKLNMKSLSNIFPSLELPCFLLSDQEEINSLYERGEGTLRYCCKYEINDKKQLVTVTGLAPKISYKSIVAKLEDLIEKDLVTVDDYTGGTVQIEIHMKDTRLFKERILPALKSTDSYRFHAIVNGEIKLLNLNEILDEWIKYRESIWSTKIVETLELLKLEKRKAETRIVLINKYEEWVEAMREPDLKKVRAKFSALVGEDMVDYALDLQIKQILKFDTTKINSLIKDIDKKIQYWTKIFKNIHKTLVFWNRLRCSRGDL